jgi:hypothetical protein
MPSVDLVVAKDIVGSEETGGLIFNYIKKNKLNIPVIIFGGSDQYDKGGDFDRFGTFLPSNTDMRSFVRTCARHLGITARTWPVKLYLSILDYPFRYFYNLEETKNALYLKEKNEDSIQFDPLFSPNDKFENSTIDELKNDGIKSLFIHSKTRVEFVNDYTQRMIHKVLDTTPEDKKMEVLKLHFLLLQSN